MYKCLSTVYVYTDCYMCMFISVTTCTRARMRINAVYAHVFMHCIDMLKYSVCVNINTVYVDILALCMPVERHGLVVRMLGT